MEKQNQVYARGRLISTRERKDGTVVIVVRSVNGKRDIFPRFYCTKDKLPKLSNHAQVEITGHFESSRFRNDEGKMETSQRLIADEIIPARTMTEVKFGVKGKFFYPPEVTALIQGTVTSVKDEGGWYRYIIDITNGSRKNTIRVSMKELERMPVITKGTNICAVCVMSTPMKVLEGDKNYFEDVIITDLAVI